MDHPEAPQDVKQRPITLLAGGCLIVLYAALCVIVGVFGRQAMADRDAPTPTPTNTPVPQILVHLPTDQTPVIHEEFSSNENDWGLHFGGKLEIINGKLVLQSVVPNGIAIGTSNQISPTSESYYVQADFFTDTDTNIAYGLVFGLNRSLGTYYLFEIFPQSSAFRLFKANAGKWTELVPYTGTNTSRYPNLNTLSVYFDRGAIQLYINGELVSEYSDQDFLHSKQVGVYVDDIGYRLLVDDLFIYNKK